MLGKYGVAALSVLVGVVVAVVCPTQGAIVQWILDGDGPWNDAANWSSNPTLPGPSDDVIIDVGGATVRQITHAAGGNTIASMSNAEHLIVAGGSLTITGNLTLLDRGVLDIRGAGTTFNAQGATDIDSGVLRVTQGSKVNLPGVTSYMAPGNLVAKIEATGAGSMLDLPNLASFTGSAGPTVELFASNGGKLNMANLPMISGGDTFIRAEGAGSVVDLSSLTSFVDTVPANSVSVLWVRQNGTIKYNPSGLEVTNVIVILETGGSLEGGTLTIGSGSRLEVHSAVQVNTVNTNFVDRLYTPYGALPFAGDFTQTATGISRIRLGGPEPVTEHDQIQVSGKATLAGGVEIFLQNQFMPALGSFFPVLTSAQREGSFDLGGAPIMNDRLLVPAAAGTTVYLFTIYPGDANIDGAVNLADFNALKTNFGGTGGVAKGDFNGGLLINLADFNILKANFGRSNGPRLSDLPGGGASSVPEPSTKALAILALSAFSIARILIRDRRRLRLSSSWT